ncbi:MAG: transglycosylase domain-containing protein, partial [Acetobacteraceae bacterium]|nr:transglycosylase domain-containing protein [Acetobacteraceae bacterium]
MGVTAGGRLPGGRRGAGAKPVRLFRILADAAGVLRWLTFAVILILVGLGVAYEVRTSYLQARLFTWLDSGIGYSVTPGASQSIRFPKYGPRDVRLGYTELPAAVASLTAHDFRVVRQAQWSSRLQWFVAHGEYPPYTPAMQAGLQMFDRNGVQLFKARYPERVFGGFEEIPPLIASTLTFIEDHDLLDTQYPLRDPAVAWKRFIVAAFGHVGGLINRHWEHGGASTLATQIVKFDDSPAGRTESVSEKLRQMVSAGADAYRGGPETMAARRQILLTYLNSTPLASRPGYGEVIGLPEALWVWYGTDPVEAARLLTQPVVTGAALTRQGEVYRQVLSLILAGQRPAYYLIENHAALESLINAYLHLLADEGIISPMLDDAAAASRLQFRADVPAPQFSFVDNNKVVGWLQSELLALLQVPSLWSLQHFDLSVSSSIDEQAQQRVTDVLTRLGDPAYDRSLGLIGKQMLGDGNPAQVNWSFVLYERGDGANYVRIHADSLDAPFDINSGAKLQLGSTAKLRTVITYLEITVALHGQLASESAAALRQIAAGASDNLTRWAAGYLAGTQDRGLKPMLEVAMQRTYSAAPVTFFTGGGNNSFGNFEPWENDLVPTVEFAFEHSINCAFVRLMRDIRDYYIAQSGLDEKKLLYDPQDSARAAYLRQFIEKEGLTYLHKFYIVDRGLSPSEVLDRLASHTKPLASHLAVLFLTVHPDATQAEMTAFLKAHMPRATFSELDDERLATLYDEFCLNKLSLNDEGYVAGIHPLALWLARYLQGHANASWGDIVKASSGAIQQAYVWLYRPHKTFQQNVRIRIILEQEAFARIWEDWRRQGYSFEHLVPSLGTAIGASGDRPDALADLMGIIVNNGVRQPTVDLETLNFGDGTPYQTDFAAQLFQQPVLDPLLAATVRKALMGVVHNGTASVLKDAYGSLLAVGGKTGSGDNRYHVYGPGGALRGERAV